MCASSARVLECIDHALDENAPLPIVGECQSIGEAVGSHVSWPKHLIKLRDQVILLYIALCITNLQLLFKYLINVSDYIQPKTKVKKFVDTKNKPIDLSDVPKSLSMLYKCVKIVLDNGGNVEIELDNDAFGHESHLYVNIEDIEPFCQLKSISYTCIVVYMW